MNPYLFVFTLFLSLQVVDVLLNPNENNSRRSRTKSSNDDDESDEVSSELTDLTDEAVFLGRRGSAIAMYRGIYGVVDSDGQVRNPSTVRFEVSFQHSPFRGVHGVSTYIIFEEERAQTRSSGLSWYNFWEDEEKEDGALAETVFFHDENKKYHRVRADGVGLNLALKSETTEYDLQSLDKGGEKKSFFSGSALSPFFSLLHPKENEKDRNFKLEFKVMENEADGAELKHWYDSFLSIVNTSKDDEHKTYIRRGELKFDDNPDEKIVLYAREINMKANIEKAWSYAFLLDAVAVLEIATYARHLTVSGRETQINLYVLIGLAYFTVWDIFSHAIFSARDANIIRNYGVHRRSWGTFTFTYFLKFLLFALLQVRYVIQIWKKRCESEPFNDPNMSQDQYIRKKLAQFYVKFYVGLVVFLYFAYSYMPRYYHLMQILFQAVFAAQIYTDAQSGARNSLSLDFVRMASMLRAVPTLYQFLCPSNIFNGDIYPPLPGSTRSMHEDLDDFLMRGDSVISLEQFKKQSSETLYTRSNSADYVSVGTFNFTVGILVLLVHYGVTTLFWSQRKRGPRWFVPWSCLPHVYNYTKPPPPGVQHNTQIETVGAEMTEMPEVTEGDIEAPPCPHTPLSIDCVICMSEVKFFNHEEGMEPACSPCDHWFHRSCLQKWMEIKMECPTCRRPLPPLE